LNLHITEKLLDLVEPTKYTTGYYLWKLLQIKFNLTTIEDNHKIIDISGQSSFGFELMMAAMDIFLRTFYYYDKKIFFNGETAISSKEPKRISYNTMFPGAYHAYDGKEVFEIRPNYKISDKYHLKESKGGDWSCFYFFDETDWDNFFTGGYYYFNSNKGKGFDFTVFDGPDTLTFIDVRYRSPDLNKEGIFSEVNVIHKEEACEKVYKDLMVRLPEKYKERFGTNVEDLSNRKLKWRLVFYTTTSFTPKSSFNRESTVFIGNNQIMNRFEGILDTRIQFYSDNITPKDNINS